MIKHEINEELGHVTVSFAGELLLEELVSCEDNLLSDPVFSKSMPRIYDLSDIELDLKTSGLVRIVDVCRNWEIPNETKVALIGNPAGMPTINLFVTHFGDQALLVCRNKPEAVRWLKEDDLADLSGDERFKVIILRGKISLDDILDAQRDWYASEDYDGDKPVLWDLRNTSSGSSIKEMHEKVPYVVSSSQNARRSGRTSILVNSHLMEMLVRDLIALGDWRDGSRLFNKIDDAIAWITDQVWLSW